MIESKLKPRFNWARLIFRVFLALFAAWGFWLLNPYLGVKPSQHELQWYNAITAFLATLSVTFIPQREED